MAQWQIGDYKNPCLVVIDAQKKYLDTTDMREKLATIEGTVREAIRRQWPVYWTRYAEQRRGSVLNFNGGRTELELGLASEASNDFVETLAPDRFLKDASRAVYSTRHYSSFSNPQLAARLDKHDLIVLCGGWAEYCVLCTAVHAFVQDKSVAIVADAVFSENKRRQEKALQAAAHAVALLCDASSLGVELPTRRRWPRIFHWPR